MRVDRMRQTLDDVSNNPNLKSRAPEAIARAQKLLGELKLDAKDPHDAEELSRLASYITKAEQSTKPAAEVAAEKVAADVTAEAATKALVETHNAELIRTPTKYDPETYSQRMARITNAFEPTRDFGQAA